MTDPAADLFGEPALIKGEDKERYMSLFAMVEADMKPKTFLDRMMVQEQTNKIWEEQRLRSNAAALTEGAFPEALEILLRPFCDITTGTSSAIARNYYSGDSKTKEGAASFLAKCGITTAQIQAKAMQINSGGHQTIDRMINNRENSRRGLRKEFERRSAVNDNAPARVSDEPEEGTES